jgi:predicted metal-dependent hydrolase
MYVGGESHLYLGRYYRLKLGKSGFNQVMNAGKNLSRAINLNLIKMPKECIKYVVAHELCHLLHHNHGPGFYQLLERLLPDWVKRKHKLEMALV